MPNLRSRTFACTALVTAFALGSVPAHAEGDVEKAARLFKEGRAATTAGDNATACPKFSEAQRLDPAPGTLLNLGLCEEALGKLASAFEHLKAVAAQLPADDKRAKYAADKADAIALKVPRLRISLAPGAPDDTTIERDGRAPVEVRKLGGQIFLDPGEHSIVATAPGRPARRYSVTLAPGEVQSLVLEPGAAAGAPAPPPAPAPAPTPVERAAPPEHAPDVATPGWSTQAKIGFASIGLGGALLATGAVTGAMVLGDKSTVQSSCHGTSVCDSQAGVDAAKQGRTLSIVSTVGFIGGAALAGVGIALVVTGRPRSATAGARTPASSIAFVPSAGGITCVGAF